MDLVACLSKIVRVWGDFFLHFFYFICFLFKHFMREKG